jgi:beta-fructofuranosidase
VFGKTKGPAVVCSTPEGVEQCNLDIIVEPNLIEVFVNGGQYVISNVVYGLGSAITGAAAHIFTPSP